MDAVEKIIYFRRLQFPSKAANAINTFRLCEAFGKAGYNTELWIPTPMVDPGELYEEYGVAASFSIKIVSSRYSGRGSEIVLAYRMAKAIAAAEANWIYGRDEYVAAFLTLMGKRVFLDLHRPPLSKGLKHRILSRVYQSSKLGGITVVSNKLRDYYLAIGMPTQKVEVVRNSAHIVTRSVTHRGDKKKDTQFTIGYIGHLYPGRGVELILHLAEVLPDVEFQIYGGDEKTIAFWKAKKKLANVRFRGFVSPGLVPSLFAGFDALLAPYQRKVLVSDGVSNSVAYMSPVKLFEYMGSGVPIVTSRLPAIEEFLGGDSALLCAPDKPEEWIAAIQKINNDPTFGRSLAIQALDEMEKKYSWERRIAKLIAFFRLNSTFS